MDNNTAKLVLTVAAIAGLERMKTLRLKKTNAKLVQDNENLTKIAAFSIAQADYYASILDRNDIKITEFDQIALNQILTSNL